MARQRKIIEVLKDEIEGLELDAKNSELYKQRCAKMADIEMQKRLDTRDNIIESYQAYIQDLEEVIRIGHSRLRSLKSKKE